MDRALDRGRGGFSCRSPTARASGEASELDPEEAGPAFDQIARNALGLSGPEFLQALDEGKFDDVDPDSYPGLLDVLMALPLVR